MKKQFAVLSAEQLENAQFDLYSKINLESPNWWLKMRTLAKCATPTVYYLYETGKYAPLNLTGVDIG